MFSENLKNSNINLSIKREPTDGYWTDIWRKKPFCTSYWTGRAPALLTLETEAAAEASWNDSYRQNKEFNSLLKTAQATKDFAKRRDYVMEAQRIMSEEGGAITPIFATDINGIANYVKGFIPHAERAMTSRRLHETVWLDK